MRKDKGLNGDLDRLPMLTWIMFLKFLDDLERWRKWRPNLRARSTARPSSRPIAGGIGLRRRMVLPAMNLSSSSIMMRPFDRMGRKGRACSPTFGIVGAERRWSPRRDCQCVPGIQNRMISGYLLRDVVNLIDGIHFNAADEIHTLGHLYESMLREMRDTAGDSGEFYTPRPVVRFMVEVTDPRLTEVVLDPACGTGGFLSESYGHLEKQCKTVADMKVLQEKSIFGGEAKPLPYMLAK